MAFREQPVASRVLDSKWQDRNFRLHKLKVQNTKSSINNKAPPEQPHLYLRLKKAALDEEKTTRIERDNRILVKRMTEIMQRSAIDTRNAAPLPGGGRVKSLNNERRHRELVRITAENQCLLRRIQQRGPTYNHLQWEQDRAKNEEHITRLARHPVKKRDWAGSAAYYYDDQGASGQAFVDDDFGGFGGDQPAPPPATAPPAGGGASQEPAESKGGASSYSGGSSSSSQSASGLRSSSASSATPEDDAEAGEGEGEGGKSDEES